ncbi:hypothetical protein [Oceanisphaera psychrotolerans]|uniref:HTH araC/xylS-type domain-containing protein n=1 Tax=Oceanisphaera psychrotolerans TaxID=1414654 RepID=A0A1J4QGW0_9GAMM|nr:hypothetical protein [Oceanisphaera psychrotolerans]OIN13525.1 hypothetical protein BFR47_10215 [Oceanisphaera psychrotolerans]
MTTTAHYSIHHQLVALPHLTPGKRQRHIKGVLLMMHQGAGLLQLGRHYYPLATHEAAFLPADTLFAWHGFAHSRLSRVEFSPRLAQPSIAGRLTPSPLLAAIVARLADWTGEQDWQGAHGRLCRILHDELPQQTILPVDSQPPLHQLITANPASFALAPEQEPEFRRRFDCDADNIRRQCALLLVLRDLAKSPSLDALVQAYGFASVPQFEQYCRHWLGSPCHRSGKNG